MFKFSNAWSLRLLGSMISLAGNITCFASEFCKACCSSFSITLNIFLLLLFQLVEYIISDCIDYGRSQISGWVIPKTFFKQYCFLPRLALCYEDRTRGHLNETLNRVPVSVIYIKHVNEPGGTVSFSISLILCQKGC